MINAPKARTPAIIPMTRTRVHACPFLLSVTSEDKPVKTYFMFIVTTKQHLTKLAIKNLSLGCTILWLPLTWSYLYYIILYLNNSEYANITPSFQFIMLFGHRLIRVTFTKKILEFVLQQCQVFCVTLVHP